MSPIVDDCLFPRILKFGKGGLFRKKAWSTSGPLEPIETGV